MKANCRELLQFLMPLERRQIHSLRNRDITRMRSLEALTAIDREKLLALAQAAKVKRKSTPALPILPIDRDRPLELSFAQQRLWFLAQFEGASEAYHIASGLRLIGDLDRAALRRALDRIVARHEALRTRFELIEGQPAQ